ncbi:MAG: hypothetical protein ACK55I_04365, partial [bacterium]
MSAAMHRGCESCCAIHAAVAWRSGSPGSGRPPPSESARADVTRPPPDWSRPPPARRAGEWPVRACAARGCARHRACRARPGGRGNRSSGRCSAHLDPGRAVSASGTRDGSLLPAARRPVPARFPHRGAGAGPPQESTPAGRGLRRRLGAR